jgi:hypothetical protein
MVAPLVMMTVLLAHFLQNISKPEPCRDRGAFYHTIRILVEGRLR